MHSPYKWLVTSCVVLLFTACEKSPTAIDMGYDYFPLSEKLTRVYDVVEVFHDVDLVPAHDTFHYQIKEVIGEPFTDGQGETAYEFSRYRRVDENGIWQLKDVWTAKRNAVRAEQVEENQRVVAMAFPINTLTVWDKHALNTLDETNSIYSRYHQPITVGGFSFDSTCRAEHQNFISFVDYRIEYADYAKYIGQVRYVIKDLVIDQFDTLNIQKGHELSMSLIDYEL